MPGEYTNVITPEGDTVSIPTDAVASVMSSDPRYRIEGVAQAADRAANIGARKHLKGTASAIEAGLTSTLSGATLGGFDAIVAASGQGRQLGEVRREHSGISTGGEILGALLTAIPTGGTSLETAGLRAAGKQAVDRLAIREAERLAGGGAASTIAGVTPSGWLSSQAAKVAERGSGGGFVKRVGYDALGAGLEGAGQSVGSYVSDVALGDRDLSAEGLLGAAGEGAILGGGAGAVIGVSEHALHRARDLFPSTRVTREVADAGERQAAGALDDMMRDSADLEQRAQAALGDIRKARATDPQVAEHAARIRAEREAAAVAQRAQAEARAVEAQARADLAQVRLDKAKAGPTPRQRRAKGTPSDGVPVPISDAPLGDTLEVQPWPRSRPIDFGDPASSLEPSTVAGKRKPALAPADEMSDIERALAATKQRMDSGESFAALSAEGRQSVRIGDDVDEAIALVDPTAARLRQLTEQTRLGRQGVEEYLALIGKRADDAIEKKIAAGTLKRDRDILYSADGAGDVLGAKLGVRGSGDDLARGSRSRLRNPYTDEELIAKAERNPTFLDTADTTLGAPARTTARDDLIERILSGKTKTGALQVEDLAPRIDQATGEILPGLDRVPRQANADDVLRAVESNRRDPAFGSYVTDDIMQALRGRLDLSDDLAHAIPAIQRLEKAEAELATALGQRATPGSVRRAADYARAETAHIEARALADTQRMAALEHEAMPQISDAAAKASAADVAAAGGLPTQALPDPLPGAVALPGIGEGKGGKLADIAAAIEVMSSLGIPGLPSAKDIPVVGPILGLYLKARAAAAVWKKLGGKMPATVEGIVAKRSAATRDRMNEAVRSMLGSASRSVGRKPVQAAAVAEVLGRSVFSDSKRKRAQKETLAEMWARHRQEIASAQRPGAIEKIMRDRVPTGDPRLAASLATAAKRRIAYLDQMMPRPPAGAPDPDAPPWHPTPAQAERWARIVDATEDPAGVLERAAVGQVSIDQIEAVRAVYPKLYDEARSTILEALADGKRIPRARRVQLGVIFAMPIDPTQDPAFMASMQAGYAEPQPAAPTPRPSANVNLSGPDLLQEQQP